MAPTYAVPGLFFQVLNVRNQIGLHSGKSLAKNKYIEYFEKYQES